MNTIDKIREHRDLTRDELELILTTDMATRFSCAA